MISERYQENVTKIKIVHNAPFLYILRGKKESKETGIPYYTRKYRKFLEGDWREKRKHHGKIGFGLVKMNNKVLGVLYEVYLRFILLEI